MVNVATKDSGSQKCYTSQHLQPKEYGLWEVCMRLTSGGRNTLYFDGRMMASRFAHTSKSAVYRIVSRLVDCGWLRPLNGSGRKVASDTRRYEPTEYQVLSHSDWVKEHGTAECASPKIGNGVGMEPVPVLEDSIPENDKIPFPKMGHSFVSSSVKNSCNPSFVANPPELVSQIWHAYPKNSHLADQLQIPADDAAVIGEAVAKDGDMVLKKTKAYASAVSRWPAEEKRMMPSTFKFFQQRQYRRDAAEWESQNPIRPKPTQMPNPADLMRKLEREIHAQNAKERNKEIEVPE